MLSDAQLDTVKAELEGGRNLRDIVTEDYAGEKPGAVRRQLVEKFTGPVIQQIMMDTRLQQLSVEDLNTRITQVQGRLDRITAIRDAKL
jgi:uncharacterized small protein (DUF1192 family)